MALPCYRGARTSLRWAAGAGSRTGGPERDRLRSSATGCALARFRRSADPQPIPVRASHDPPRREGGETQAPLAPFPERISSALAPPSLPSGARPRCPKTQFRYAEGGGQSRSSYSILLPHAGEQLRLPVWATLRSLRAGWVAGRLQRRDTAPDVGGEAATTDLCASRARKRKRKHKCPRY